MKFTALYERVINLWPETVPISDSAPSGEDGLRSADLVSVYDRVEAHIKKRKRDREWLRLMNWSLYQVFHAYAETSLEKGAATIRCRDVPLETIQARFATNLSLPDRAKLKALYVNDL